MEKPQLFAMRTATQRLQRDIFPTELDLLNGLFLKVKKNEAMDTSEEKSGLVKPVYRLRVDDYQLLLTHLYCQRQVTLDALTIIGRTAPSLPGYGLLGDVSEWYNENNFEILCVCFRLEVENFLWELDQAFDYPQGHSRALRDVLTEEPSHITQQTVQDLPLHMEPDRPVALSIHSIN
jgi:hypothetical protein